MPTMLKRGVPPISLEADTRYAQVTGKLREKETHLHHLHAQRAALVAPQPTVPEDPTALTLARAEALLGDEGARPAEREDPLPALMEQIAETHADIVALRHLEERELDRVSAAICGEWDPAHRQGIKQMVDGLLLYNAGAEAERAVRERLNDAGIRNSLRPIVLHELGLLREEYSRSALLFRELDEYGLLDTERRQRAEAAGWRA